MRHAHPLRDLDAAGVAWVVLALIACGIRARTRGWCIGALRLRDIECVRGVLLRRTRSGRAHQRRLRARARRHARTGHDRGCWLLGVPRATLERVISECAEPRVRAFGVAVADAVCDELERTGVGPRRGWSAKRAHAAAHHAVISYVTPVEPGVATAVENAEKGAERERSTPFPRVD